MTQSAMRSMPGFARTWVPFTLAIASFIISGYTFIVTTREPVVDVVLPQQIRIAQGEDLGYAYAYFQPTFVHAGPSQQVEVVTEIRIELSRSSQSGGASNPPALEWRESGSLDYDPTTQALTYVYTGDATPLLLSRESALSPLGVFYGPPGFLLTAGDWHANLIAGRAAGAPDLRAAFSFSISEEEIATLNDGQGSIFLRFPITPR